MTKFVMSTMLLIGFRPIAVSRYCSHSGEGCTVTFSNTSALYRGQRSRSSICTWIAAAPCGQQVELRPGRVSVLPEDGGDFARHAVMAPQVGPVRDALVVDLDDAVGDAAGERRADLRVEFEDAGVIAVDAEFRAAGQHAVALDAVDDLLRRSARTR